MKLMVLQRIDKNAKRCYGRMEDEHGKVVCEATLEEPHRDEDGDGITDRGRSCIPAGTYEMFLRKSKRNGGTGGRDYDVWELEGVPGRTNVQVHIGNDLEDTEGCILVGSARSHQKPLDEKGYVIGSGPAHGRWMDALKGETRARLKVVDP